MLARIDALVGFGVWALALGVGVGVSIVFGTWWKGRNRSRSKTLAIKPSKTEKKAVGGGKKENGEAQVGWQGVFTIGIWVLFAL